jgi:VWFA-related protein
VLLLLVGFAVSEVYARPQQAPPAPAGPATSSPQPTPTPNPQAGAPPQQPPIVSTTGLVHLVVTVVDRHHDFITDLDKGDFKVLDNGTPQVIRFFGRETDLPLRIALLLDTSNSIRPRLKFEKDAAMDFLDKVIRREKDLAFLMTFDNEPQVIQDYTDDVGRLTDAIRDQRAGGGTALNDALYVASQKLAKAPLPDGPNKDMRRVIVLISDGNDNLSDRAPSDATEAIIRGETAVYTISTNTDWVALDAQDAPRKYDYTDGDKILQSFSDQTGGRAFYPYKVEDLGESFVQIGAELRSQYFIAYEPSTPPDGKYRKIDVQVGRKNLQVRTRKGYYAEAAQQKP